MSLFVVGSEKGRGAVSGSVVTVDEVKALVAELLGIGDRVEAMSSETGLLGSLPELDSMAVVELVQGLEDRFGIVMDDNDVSAETFETIGSLAEYVDARRSI